MRAPAGRRPQSTTPTPLDPRHFKAFRDSAASFCSSRPSSANHHRTPSAVAITDRSYQTNAVSTINSYLSTCSFPISFKLKPLPSNKDITETLKFVLAQLDYPVGNKIEDDLVLVLKGFNCPIKMNKSALKAPGTPHSFPSVLAVLYWLVQTAMYNEHIARSTRSQSIYGDSMFSSNLNSYLHYIRGDDDAVERVDEDFMSKLQQEKNLLLENVNVLSENAKDLEAKLEAMKSRPSLKEAKEEEKRKLEIEMEKYNDLIKLLQEESVKEQMEAEEKEKRLRIRMEQRKKTCEEYEELKKKVDEQAIDIWEEDRMKRELQSVEGCIGDADTERNEWEDKCWNLGVVIGTKFKELEALQTECNQAIRRLKLGNDIHYKLNAEGTTPAEVLGMDYKSRLEPVLSSSRDDVRRSSMKNLETLTSLQQLSRDFAAKIDAKRNRITILQSRNDGVENKLNLVKNETQYYTSRCAMEARQLIDNFNVESHQIDLVGKEARELVESLKAKLQETIAQCEVEVEICARELLALIDSVSKYKEFTVCRISKMNNAVLETAAAIAEVHKGALTSYLGI